MAADVRCVREVTAFADSQDVRKLDITIASVANTTIRTDEDTSCQVAGGYGYRRNTRPDSVTNNRFILWKINDNILELSEYSLDVNLSGNRIQLRFTDGKLLPKVSVYESAGNVILLIATTTSVHRLVFPHPDRLPKHTFFLSSSSNVTLPSIFNLHSIPEVNEPWNLAVFSTHCLYASGWLCQDGQVLFALATASGSILLIKLPPPGNNSESEQFELRKSSVMQRLWSGLVPTSLRGVTPDADGVLELTLQPLGKQMCIFTLCRDHKFRIWSCQKQECIAVKNLLDDVSDDIDSQSSDAQSHRMCKYVQASTGRVYIAVHLCFPFHKQFSVYEAVASEESICMLPVYISHVDSEMGSLVDFSLTAQHVWATFSTTDGEPVTMFTGLEGDASSSCWKRSTSSIVPSQIVVPAHREPREVFLDELFYPGRLRDQAILKAVQIYPSSPSLPPSAIQSLLSNRQELQQLVTSLIDGEIQLNAPDGDLSYDEYFQLQLRCWEQFYSYVIQYHVAGCKPFGLFADDTTDLVCVIRKEMVSFLRPCDAIEKISLMSDEVDPEDFYAEPFLEKNSSTRSALTLCCKAFKLVTDTVTDENKAAIEYALLYKGDPEVTAKEIASSLLAHDRGKDKLQTGDEDSSPFAQTIEARLQAIPDLLSCLEIILQPLDLSGMNLDSTKAGNPDWLGDGCKQVFGSTSMILTLCLSFQQMVNARMNFCRDLLVLLCIVERLESRAFTSPQRCQDISSLYIPHACRLLRCYHTLHWIAEQKPAPAPSNAYESNLKQLAALEISDGMQRNILDLLDHSGGTLLEAFIQSSGGQQLRDMVSRTQGLDQQSFGAKLKITLSCLAGLLWPTQSILLADFLLSNCQHMLLQGYCHLIAGWGAIFQTHHDFLCGQSHLVTGEHHKALEHFTKAAEGIVDEDGSIRKLLQSDSQDPASLVVLYYVKVMRLFEQFEVLDMVISVANTALSIANSKDPNVPNLWSNIFKHHLELGHNDEAYAALTSNPDPSRRRDCLHRFMVVLCERGQLQELCEYPYVNLKDQFVGIMESHARTVDITTHQFYDLLYAFHMFRGDYRKAGNVMYEYGGRLGRELPGKSGLQKQAKCYLAAMNALRLVEPKNAWIVTPWDHAQNKTTEPPNMSPKRKQGDEESWYGDSRPKPRRKLTVLEIGDLEREYLLVLARLQLLRMDADPSQGTGPALTPKETQTLLIQVGLFDTAFTVAETFKLPRDAIFEGLASRCVKLSYNCAGISRNGGLDEDGAWDWLRANDSVGPSFSQDKSTADQAWHLLQYYLDKQGTHLDKQGMHEGRSYHRCVATKLLSLGAHLPSWLVNDFKRLSPSELLYLYVTYDMLQEATDLAIEYIHAVQGDGKEHFGLKTALHANMPSVWLPYTTLDHLLVALGEASENSTLAIAREELVEKLERYHDHVERVSETMVTTAWKRAAQTTQG